MIKNDLKIIRKWSKLRHWDYKNVEKSALNLYNSLDDHDKPLMLQEFQNYIDGVKSGKIIPEPVKLKIPRFMRKTKDIKAEKDIIDYYKGK